MPTHGKQIIKNIQDIFSISWSSLIRENVIKIKLKIYVVIKKIVAHFHVHLPKTTIKNDKTKIIDKTKKSITNHLNFFIDFNNYKLFYFIFFCYYNLLKLYLWN